MMDGQQIKNCCMEFGADLVGVAPVSRFAEAPTQTHPRAVLAACRSVIVFACRFPAEATNDSQAYTQTRNALVQKTAQIAEQTAAHLRQAGFDAEPIGYTASLIEGRYCGPISLKHAAVLAGLGKMGKNTLVVNDKYGNMIWLGAVLTSMDMQADAPAAYSPCRPACRLCIQSCPAGALGGERVNQMACLAQAFRKVENGQEILCWTCRQVCPNQHKATNHQTQKKSGG